MARSAGGAGSSDPTSPNRRRRRRNRGNPGGNPGGNGGDGNAVHQEAKRQFHLMIRPYMDQIRQAQREATQTTDQTINRQQNVWDAYGSQVGALNAPMQSTIAGIGDNLSAQTAALAPVMNQSIGQAPPSEVAAAGNLVGAIGTGGLNQIAQIGATGAASNTSAQLQGIQESAVGQRNALGDLSNFHQDLAQQKVDLLKQAPAQIKQLMTDIEQRNLNNKLGLGQLAISQGNLGVSQAGLDLQRDQFNLDQQGQDAVDAFLQSPGFAKYLKTLTPAQQAALFASLGG